MHYEDDVASDPRIDQLRSKMHVSENECFSLDYHSKEKRSIANSIQIKFKDGSETELVTVEYPIGHRRRREEGLSVLLSKFKQNMSTQFSPEKIQSLLEVMSAQTTLENLSVVDFMSMWVKE